MNMEMREPFIGYPAMVTISALAVATTYYIFSVAKKPKIFTSNQKLRHFLQSHMDSVNEKYYPNYVIWEGRLQSILGLNLRLPDSHLLPYVREVFNLKDGGAVGLDFLFPENVDDDSVVVYVLPGLTSHSQTCYIKTLVLSIISAGGIAVVHNHRGLGGVPLKNARLYSASNFDDAREVAGYLNQRFSLHRKIVIGTSMGAMVMTKYLSTHPEEGKRSFVAALAISSIWDAAKGIESLEKPFINRYIINSAITQNVLEIAVKYKETIEVRDCIDYNKVLNCSNVRDFDAFFTAPSFGHKSAEDYYQDATILDRICNFSIPVFALNAEDDPFSPALPITEAEAPGSNFALITTTRGGHLGYLEGMFPLRRTSHFMERFVAEFVRAIQQGDKALM